MVEVGRWWAFSVRNGFSRITVRNVIFFVIIFAVFFYYLNI